MWLIILGIPIQDTPRRHETNKGLCFPSSTPLKPTPLVFHLHSYREWGPLYNLTDRLQKIISETSVINFSINNAVYLLSISGRVGVHVEGTRCTTGPGFHGVVLEDSLRLRHAILLPAAKMCRSFWLGLLWCAQVALWGEGDGERKGGVRVQTKGSHRDSLSVIKFVETQKEQQSHSQGHLEGEKGGYRTAFFVSELQSFLSSNSRSSLCSTLLLHWLQSAPCQQLKQPTFSLRGPFSESSAAQVSLFILHQIFDEARVMYLTVVMLGLKESLTPHGASFYCLNCIYTVFKKIVAVK